nr:hypothetical protein [Candidatus Freyarchaeota archaeon]
MEEDQIKKKILEYITKNKKSKLCIIDIFLRNDRLSDSEVKDFITPYYPCRLFSISKIYEELKREGLLLRDTAKYKEYLPDRDSVLKVFKELEVLIAPIISKESWGAGDVVNTLGDEQYYLIQRILMRGGLVPKDLIFSDFSRDYLLKKSPFYWQGKSFEERRAEIENKLNELIEIGYVKTTPLGYSLPDFVVRDFLSDHIISAKVLGALSRDLWMAFSYEPYISLVRKLEEKYPEMCKPILDAVEHFINHRYNDALDNINSACEKLTDMLYNKIIENGEKLGSTHAKLMKIVNRQHLWKDDPDLSERGKNAAVFLSSAIFIPKWIRDKTSHSLAKPTGDSVRLALASFLIALDVAKDLKLLE